MPISNSFKQRLYSKIIMLYAHFNGPFHIFDEEGIKNTCARLISAFLGVPGFFEFYAVKANPNPAILNIVALMGFGFDCSSIPELHKAVKALRFARKLKPGLFDENPNRLCNARIMFTSNNTSIEEFEEALRIDQEEMQVIINIDDMSMINTVADLNDGKLPETICFRYNPGPRRSSGSTAAKFGDPEGQKYEIPHEKIVAAYRMAQQLGAKTFGLHTMIASNSLEVEYIKETNRMLLEVSKMIFDQTGIKMSFVNMGGGIGIPYRPDQSEFPIEELGNWTNKTFDQFAKENGWCPDFNMECGRYITGPHGVLVSKVRAKYHKYRTIIGLEVNSNANPRPKLYGTEDDGYHHIDVVSRDGTFININSREVVDVCDSLCENNGRFATQRALPIMVFGDYTVIQDTGAHAVAMGDRYNARLLPQELLLKSDDSVIRIRRAETEDDLDATLYDFDPEEFIEV